MKNINKTINKAGFLPQDTRCPRCDGFLYDAIFNTGVRVIKSFRDMVYCMNCARFFRLEGNRLIQWPQRNGDKGYEIQVIYTLEKKSKEKSKKRR